MVLQGPGAQAPLIIRVRQPRRSLWGTSVAKDGKERGGQGTSTFSGAGGERGGRTPSAFRRPCLRMPLCAPREGESAEWRFPAPLPPQDNPGYSRPLWLKL